MPQWRIEIDVSLCGYTFNSLYIYLEKTLYRHESSKKIKVLQDVVFLLHLKLSHFLIKVKFQRKCEPNKCPLVTGDMIYLFVTWCSSGIGWRFTRASLHSNACPVKTQKETIKSSVQLFLNFNDEPYPLCSTLQGINRMCCCSSPK